MCLTRKKRRKKRCRLYIWYIVHLTFNPFLYTNLFELIKVKSWMNVILDLRFWWSHWPVLNLEWKKIKARNTHSFPIMDVLPFWFWKCSSSEHFSNDVNIYALGIIRHAEIEMTNYLFQNRLKQNFNISCIKLHFLDVTHFLYVSIILFSNFWMSNILDVTPSRMTYSLDSKLSWCHTF